MKKETPTEKEKKKEKKKKIPLLPEAEKIKQISAGKKELNTQELEKQLEECEKLRDEYLTGWKREKADFLNYKQGEGKRMEEAFNFVKKELLFEMINAYDNLERAREYVPEDLKENNWVKGILQIENQFYNFLKEQGIEQINPQGEKFNPSLHEAVEEVERKDKESGTVVEVIQKGYLLNGLLLRPARVKVVK